MECCQQYLVMGKKKHQTHLHSVLGCLIYGPVRLFFHLMLSCVDGRGECSLRRAHLFCVCVCVSTLESWCSLFVAGRLCLSFVLVPQTWDSKIPAITALLSTSRNVSPIKVFLSNWSYVQTSEWCWWPLYSSAFRYDNAVILAMGVESGMCILKRALGVSCVHVCLLALERSFQKVWN